MQIKVVSATILLFFLMVLPCTSQTASPYQQLDNHPVMNAFTYQQLEVPNTSELVQTISSDWLQKLATDVNPHIDHYSVYGVFHQAFIFSIFKFGRVDDVLYITKKTNDNFQLGYRYSVYYFFLGVWVSPEEYVLYSPEENKYRSLGDALPSDIVNHYSLSTNKPVPSFLRRLWLYSYGFLGDILIIIGLIMISGESVVNYLKTRAKFNNAIKQYKASGGNDPTVLAILNYLKHKQKRVLDVSFSCENKLIPEDKLVPQDTNLKLRSPYENFQSKNLNGLENSIVTELNRSFSSIISNDVFRFVENKNPKNKWVFFDIRYTVYNTQSVYRSDKEMTNEGFLGIVVKWSIDIHVNEKVVKQLQFDSLPAQRFTVPEGSSIKTIFDEMARTSFVDLNRKLQIELGFKN